MPNCVSYNCSDDLGDHALNDCGQELQAGLDAAIILECDHELTDPSSAAEINAEIAAGRATLIENVRIGLGEPQPQEIDSTVSGREPKLVKYVVEGTLVDGNVSSANQAFYNTLFSGRAFGGIVLKSAEETKVIWIDEEVDFKGGLPISDNTGEFMTYRGIFRYNTTPESVVPSMHTLPANIFGQ